jgi:hypothetical protein
MNRHENGFAFNEIRADRGSEAAAKMRANPEDEENPLFSQRLVRDQF